MTSNRPSSGPPSIWDEEVDLRRWLGALFRGKFIILTVVLTALSLAAIINFILISPSYESLGRISLPDAKSSDQLDMTLPDYQEIATSDATLERLTQELGSALSKQQLRDVLQSKLNKGDRSLEITASADTPETALLVAKTWTAVFKEGLRSNLQENINQKRERSTERAELLKAEMLESQKRLQTFNSDSPISQMQPQLTALESQRINSEFKLLELNERIIPGQESQLVSLRDSLDKPSLVPGSGSAPGTLALPDIGASEDSALKSSILLDPAYLLLKQNLHQGRLNALDQNLFNMESHLHQLTLFVIPSAEEKITSLEDILAFFPIVPDPSSVVPSPEIVSGAATGTPELNTPLTQVSNKIEIARAELATNQAEAEALVEDIALLEQQADTLRRKLISGQDQIDMIEEYKLTNQQIEELEQSLTTRRQEADFLAIATGDLRREAAALGEKYLTALTTHRQFEMKAIDDTLHYESIAKATVRELDNLRQIESRLKPLFEVTTADEPALPITPLATQRTRNMVISGFLGLFLGCALVLFLALYRGLPVASGTGRSQAEAVVAGAETSQ